MEKKIVRIVTVVCCVLSFWVTTASADLMDTYVFSATSLGFDQMVADANAADIYTNPNVKVGNPAAEGIWLSALLGFGLVFENKYDTQDNVPINVGQDWTYVVVKQAQLVYAYENTTRDNWLSPDPDANPNFYEFSQDGEFSHLTFFGDDSGGTGPGPDPVPEPATMLLFGTGLAGLAGFRIRKTQK